jgi:hypothetical protein
MPEQFDLFGGEPVDLVQEQKLNARQKHHEKFHYGKGSKDKRCEICLHVRINNHPEGPWYKCAFIGTSNHQTTDIGKTMVCDLFTPATAVKIQG